LIFLANNGGRSRRDELEAGEVEVCSAEKTKDRHRREKDRDQDKQKLHIEGIDEQRDVQEDADCSPVLRIRSSLTLFRVWAV
jgi:hypothetical protein